MPFRAGSAGDALHTKLADMYFPPALAGVRHYCGIDISLRGLQDAAMRFNDVNAQATAKGAPMAAKLIRADLGDTCLEASGVLAAGARRGQKQALRTMLPGIA